MDTRGGEAPMEFEWQGTGPVDPSSPFILSGIKKSMLRVESDQTTLLMLTMRRTI